MMERAPTAVMIAMALKEPARGVRRVVQYTGATAASVLSAVGITAGGFWFSAAAIASCACSAAAGSPEHGRQ